MPKPAELRDKLRAGRGNVITTTLFSEFLAFSLVPIVTGKFGFFFVQGMFYKASSEKFLIFAEAYQGEIYKVPLAVPGTPCFPLGIKTNISKPVAVDYDPVEGKIYWTDVTLEVLKLMLCQ